MSVQKPCLRCLLDEADPLVVHLHGNQKQFACSHHSTKGRGQLTAGCPYRLEDRRYVFTCFIIPVFPKQKKRKCPFAAEFHRLRGIRNKIQVYILSKQREHGKNSFCIKGLGKFFIIFTKMACIFCKVRQGVSLSNQKAFSKNSLRRKT